VFKTETCLTNFGTAGSWRVPGFSSSNIAPAIISHNLKAMTIKYAGGRQTATRSGYHGNAAGAPVDVTCRAPPTSRLLRLLSLTTSVAQSLLQRLTACLARRTQWPYSVKNYQDKRRQVMSDVVICRWRLFRRHFNVTRPLVVGRSRKNAANGKRHAETKNTINALVTNAEMGGDPS